jgi:hypothetical protein
VAPRIRLVSQPDPIDESPVATAKPSARYGAMSGARAAGFATAELHHALGRDLANKLIFIFFAAAIALELLLNTSI